ncbi:MAG: RND family transporter, partial [Christensenellales bacterium]
MQKIYRVIVNHPKTIIVIFCVMTVISAILQSGVAVNYDMTAYLPEDSPSTISLEIMKSEFDGAIPNARVMIRNVTVPEALEYKEKLLACEGVVDVTWLDDAIDIYTPLSLADSDTVETYYKDSNALFTVTVDEDKRIEAVAAMRSLIGDENALGGQAVATAVATTSTVSEISKITLFAILCVLIILLITTTSWIEPLIILCGIGVAVVINMGTNLIFGEISFVTNAAGNILQLAVSLDYSVFLMHRYEECLRENTDTKSAMVNALCKSTNSILSSGITTVIGFVALIFMRFGIGPDLGLALAKGIAISLICVFVFMPVLILTVHKPLQKTKHRSFVPGFSKFAKVVYRMMIPMVCIFVVAVAPAYLASGENAFYYGSSRIFGTDTQVGADAEAIEEIFGKSDTYVVMVPRGNTAAEKQLSDALHNIPEVQSIISYVDTVGAEVPSSYLDDDTLSLLVSENYSRMVLNVKADYEGVRTFELVETIRSVVNGYYP